MDIPDSFNHIRPACSISLRHCRRLAQADLLDCSSSSNRNSYFLDSEEKDVRNNEREKKAYSGIVRFGA